MPQKCEGALIWQVVMTKRLNIGKPNINFQMRDDRPIFRCKIC